jgi:hypothetical protein
MGCAKIDNSAGGVTMPELLLAKNINDGKEERYIIYNNVEETYENESLMKKTSKTICVATISEQKISEHKNKILGFTYKYMDNAPEKVNDLFKALKKWGAIPKDEKLSNFKRLFFGKTVKTVRWFGCKNDLANIFKLLVNDKKLLELPYQSTIWDVITACFVDADGNHFTKDQLRNSGRSKQNNKKIKDLVSYLE